MIVQVRKRFLTHLNKIKHIDLLNEVEFVIEEAAKQDNPEKITGFKWLTGYASLGRIRVESYRIGVRVDGNVITLVCLMHKEEFYSYFP